MGNKINYIGIVLDINGTLVNCKPGITSKEIDRAIYIADLVVNDSDTFKKLDKVHGTSYEQYNNAKSELECFKKFFELKKKSNLLSVVELVEVSSKKSNNLPFANTLKKNINEDFITEKINYIRDNQSRGKAVFTVGKFSCNSATKEHLRELLINQKYRVSDSYNSHGVETLVVLW